MLGKHRSRAIVNVSIPGMWHRTERVHGLFATILATSYFPFVSFLIFT